MTTALPDDVMAKLLQVLEGMAAVSTQDTDDSMSLRLKQGPEGLFTIGELRRLLRTTDLRALVTGCPKYRVGRLEMYRYGDVQTRARAAAASGSDTPDARVRSRPTRSQRAPYIDIEGKQ